ncbi:type IV secretion system protein [Novosphingobium rosa]|uniref:type IV secretion system protein n=1 Tax=Novosphingobium rosa TaxID=76978 RepID=UPI00082EE520|nr:type IV secretion system protein [Novosphingobium rosa]
MNGCPVIQLDGANLALTLRALDCATGQGAATAFSRLFAQHGALAPALTAMLTLYVGFFGWGLLTGRSRLSLAALTPRMMTIALVITFATSWLAYQNVVWQLAVGAPDQIASVIAGTHGSATLDFANKIEIIFSAIADATHQSAANAVAAPQALGNGASQSVSFLSPQGMLWISGLMLLVGTVGVMVTAKIVLAVLMALGPVFIVLALFPATRGLFEGWLKATVASALVPLLTVLVGGAMLTMIAPLIRDALLSSTEESTRGATMLFLSACVYVALMLLLGRTAGLIVAGWRLPFGAREPMPTTAPAPLASTLMMDTAGHDATRTAAASANPRVRAMMAGLRASGGDPATQPAESRTQPERARAIVQGLMPDTASAATGPGDRRLQGIGSRFRPRPDASHLSKGRL